MAANMSRKEILGKVYKMIPPMLEKFHKGKDIKLFYDELCIDW